MDNFTPFNSPVPGKTSGHLTFGKTSKNPVHDTTTTNNFLENDIKDMSIITQQKTAARFAPSARALSLFDIPAGVKIKIIEPVGDWMLVEHMGNRGWIPANQ